MIRALLLSLVLAAPASAQVVGAASRGVSARPVAASAPSVPGVGATVGVAPLPGLGVSALSSFVPAPLALSAAAESASARVVAADASALRPVPLLVPSAIAVPRALVAPGASPAAAVSAAAGNSPGPGSDGEEGAGLDKRGDSDPGRSLFDGAARHRGRGPLPEQPKKPLLHRAAKIALKGLTLSTALIAVNAGAYVATPHTGELDGALGALSFDPGLLRDAIVAGIPTDIVHGLGTAVTSLFMHGNIEHIGSNMLALALFVPFVQWRFGWVKTLGLYMAGGLAALATYTAMGEYGLVLGASAAVSAAAGAVLLTKNRSDSYSGRVLNLMAKLLAATAIVPEIWSLIMDGLSRPAEGGGHQVATLAHVIGAAVGIAAASWMILRERRKARRAV